MITASINYIDTTTLYLLKKLFIFSDPPSCIITKVIFSFVWTDLIFEKYGFEEYSEILENIYLLILLTRRISFYNCHYVSSYD